MVKVFKNDADYTYEAMIQHLNVLELTMRDGSIKQCRPVNQRLRGELSLVHLHFKDGSWKECKCSPEKHLPTISLLAKEGITVSNDDSEREYISGVRDQALKYSRRLDEGQLTDDEAVGMSKWAYDVINHLKSSQNSYNRCGSSPDELLLVLSGLASEGIGFTEDDTEKRFMINVRDKAQEHHKRLSAGNLSEQEVDNIRGWAREMRRRITRKTWSGQLPKTSRKDDVVQPSPIHKPQPKPTSVKPQRNMLPAKKTPLKADPENCATCTVIPDKYKNKSSLPSGSFEDFRYVSIPDKKKVVLAKKGKITKTTPPTEVNYINPVYY